MKRLIKILFARIRQDIHCTIFIHESRNHYHHTRFDDSNIRSDEEFKKPHKVRLHGLACGVCGKVFYAE